MTQPKEIPCAFDGNPNRIDLCQGNAQSFFRSSQGTIWPLCQACSDRQKEIMVQLVSDNIVGVPTAVGATFDIPLTDEHTLASFRSQDPERLRRLIASAERSERR